MSQKDMIQNQVLEELLRERTNYYLAKNKKIGDKLSIEDFEMLRPGDGISPMEMRFLIGKRVNKDLWHGYKISLQDIEL